MEERGSVYRIRDNLGKAGRHMYLIITPDQFYEDTINEVNALQITSNRRFKNHSFFVTIPPNTLEKHQPVESYINCLKVYLIRKDRLIEYCGRLPDKYMRLVEVKLFRSLGLDSEIDTFIKIYTDSEF